MKERRNKIFLTGATGFVGKHLLNALIKEGMEVKCCVRGNNIRKVKTIEERGGIPVTECDVRDIESLRRGIRGAKYVIHLVGIIREKCEETFEKIHLEGTRNLVTAAKEEGIEKFLHISAIGANPGEKIPYLKTKGEAENIIRNSDLNFVILRPSIILGKGSHLINLFLKTMRLFHFFPLPDGGNFLLSPVWIGDVVESFIKSLKEDITGTFDLCGPDIITYREFLSYIEEEAMIRVLFLKIPSCIMIVPLSIIEKFSIPLPVTSDQLKMLKMGSICPSGSPWKEWGITPLSTREAIKNSI